MTTIYIAPYFKWSEALTTDTGLDNTPDWYAKAMLVNTFRILSRVRAFCGFPLRINSAFRTLEVHKAIYASQGKDPCLNSFHLEGRAVDISIIGLTQKQVSKLYDCLLDHCPIEIYQTDTFIHVAF